MAELGPWPALQFRKREMALVRDMLVACMSLWHLCGERNSSGVGNLDNARLSAVNRM
jgi:hypothetical protein